MSARVVSLAEVRNLRRDWTSEDLAQFQRAAHVLSQVGLPVETDHGLTDEGDPWFVFCNSETGETFAHFARVNGRYVACAPHLDKSLSGRAFPELVERFLDRYPTVPVPRSSGSSQIYAHPMTALAALVATLFFIGNPHVLSDTSELGSAEGDAVDACGLDITDSGGVLRLLASAADAAIGRQAAVRGGREDEKASTGYFSDRAGMIIAVLAATSAITLSDADARGLDANAKDSDTAIDLVFTGEARFEIGSTDDMSDIVRESQVSAAMQRAWLAEKGMTTAASFARQLLVDGEPVGISAGAGPALPLPIVSAVSHTDTTDIALVALADLARPEVASGGGHGSASHDGSHARQAVSSAIDLPHDDVPDTTHLVVASEPALRPTAVAEAAKPIISHVDDILRSILGPLDPVRSLLHPATADIAADLQAIAADIASMHTSHINAQPVSSSINPGSLPGLAGPGNSAPSSFADPKFASLSDGVAAHSALDGTQPSDPAAGGIAVAADTSPTNSAAAGTPPAHAADAPGAVPANEAVSAATTVPVVVDGLDVNWNSLDVGLVTRLFLSIGKQVTVSEVGNNIVLFEKGFSKSVPAEIHVERLDLPGDNDVIIVGTKATFDEMAHQLYS